ncbi:hypothetical protein K7X08_010132 [Anisodus acutangulus]|uniref:Trichome birefringence-like C-terminal domain-containing protein n=1 Tax=Anisodus acutangulus TaxID=402998 RepID=A0A9Q1RUU0_9SOLA|nr:hypothetical protein K7X08_010132 [Anisodus acutangulus]
MSQLSCEGHMLIRGMYQSILVRIQSGIVVLIDFAHLHGTDVGLPDCRSLAIAHWLAKSQQVITVQHVYLSDPKLCTGRCRCGPFANALLFVGFLESGNTMLTRTTAKNVTTLMLLHFPFDPGSNDRHSSDVTKMFDESCLVPFDRHKYDKSSCLDNERGVFDDIIGRNSLVVLGNNSTQLLVVHFDVVKKWQLLAKSHISHSVGLEYHVEIFSFVDKDQLEPRAIWRHNKILSVAHIIFPTIKFDFGIEKFLVDRSFNDMMTLEVNMTKYEGVVILVFNTRHWLFHERTFAGAGYYQESCHVYGALYVVEVFSKAMTTQARRIVATIDLMKKQDLFREYSVSHFGGEELHQP